MSSSIAEITKEEDNVSFLLPSVKVPLTKSHMYTNPAPSLAAKDTLAENKEPWVLGVDEAGRGPCLGPMVYAISFCPLSKHKQFKEHGFDDSKKLTEEKRTELAKMIQKNKDWIGWAVYVLSPQDISANMFKRPVYNLNEMAHDATIKLIQHVVGLGIDIQTIYVDPVGPSNTYRKKLESYFPNVEIIVEPKADALYPIVSAASICAKVTRDQYMQHWQWTEPGLIDLSKKFGSGYPSDPATKEWLKTNQDAFFGFPSITRFSWSTIIKLMEGRTRTIWDDEVDEEGEQEPTTKKAKKLYEEKLAKKERKRQKEAKYNHHKKSRIIRQLGLETSDLLL